MKLKVSVLIITLLSVCLVSQCLPNLPPFSSISSLPYQAHSFNSINYIVQLLKRGVHNFKIDVSLANYQSCSKNSNWNKSEPWYRTDQYAEEYCCLALKGDASARNSFDYSFDIVQDFANMLENYLLTHPIDKILIFAINHQFKFRFDNVISQNFIFRLAKLMEKYPKLQIGFGSDDFILEYDRICKNSQIMSNKPLFDNFLSESCTDQRKFISNSRFFLQSGSDNPSDPRDYHSRYRNFNVFFQDIVNRCNNGFPSWVKKYPQFPLMFWEPSNQQQIQKVLTLFLSDKCKLHHGRGIQGLAITTNIDPQVFQFYLKSINQQVNQKNIAFQPNSQKISLQFSSNFITKMNVQNSAKISPNGNYIVLGSQSDPDTSKTNPQRTLQIVILGVDSTSQKVWQKMRKSLGVSKRTINIIGGYNSLTIIQQTFSTQAEQVQLTLLDNNLNTLASSPLTIQNYVAMCYYRNFYYTLRRTSNPTVFNIIRSNPAFTTNSIIMSLTLLTEKAKSVTDIIVFQDQDQTLRFILTGSIDSNVWVAELRNQQIYRSFDISFGTNPKFTLKQNGMILLSIQNGPCNSGVLLNNGDTPLCSFFKYPQFSSLKSIGGTITFIQFSFAHFISHAQSVNPSLISPCVPQFIHYKVMNGKDVQVVDVWDRLFVVSQYLHVSQIALMGSLFCAPSNFQNLKSGMKGIMGTIWSRNNLGHQNKIDQPTNHTQAHHTTISAQKMVQIDQ